MDNEIKIISRAVQLVELGRYKMAIDLIQENLAVLEGLGPVYQMLAFCHLQLDEYSEALKCLDISIERNPEDESSHVLQGASYLAKGELDLASNSFKIALNLNANLIEAHVGLARIYLMLEKTSNAKKHIDQAIGLDPNNEEALHIKSVFEKLLGFDEESKSTLLKGLNINPLNKSLLFEKANRDLKSNKSNNAQEIYQQLILENPNDFLLEQKIIESRLSQNWMYRNLLFKYRLFHSTSYLMTVFILAFVLFGGVAYSSLIEGSQTKIVVKICFLAISTWSGVFWIGRLVSHAWMAKKIWNKPIQYYLNPYFSSGFYAFLSFLFFGLFLLSNTKLYLAASIFLAFFSILFVSYIFIERKTTRWIYTLWFIWLHIAGIGSIIYSGTEKTGGLLNKLLISGDLLAFSIIIPLGLLMFYVGGKGMYEDWKNKKGKAKTEEETEELNIPKWHSLLYVGLFVMLIGLRILYSLVGQNIMNPILFYIIWILIPVGIYLYLHKSGKLSNWYKRSLSKFNFDANYVSSFYILAGLFSIMFSLLVGFLTINFLAIDRIDISSRVIENGMIKEEPKPYLMIEYDGYKEKVRPKNIKEFPNVDTANVTVKMYKSLFGIMVLDSIKLNEAFDKME